LVFSVSISEYGLLLKGILFSQYSCPNKNFLLNIFEGAAEFVGFRKDSEIIFWRSITLIICIG
jgi:hypothetical protein